MTSLLKEFRWKGHESKQTGETQPKKFLDLVRPSGNNDGTAHGQKFKREEEGPKIYFSTSN